jgi:thiamine-monophosphate kinase
MVKHRLTAERRTRSETDWLDAVRRRVKLLRGGETIVGIGDDCAVFRPRGAAEDLLFTTDLLIEDIHFRRSTHTARQVGWKALARGLSDIAAMGGTPRFVLLSLAVAPWCDARWLRGFYDGLLALAGREGAVLAGGDLGHAAKLACDVVVCGAVARGRALLRSGARAGDRLYVSGRLGGSALGLAGHGGAARKRHLQPEPRIALGRFLLRLGASAAMDLSDGLSLDLRRLCLESKLSAEITAPPLFPGASPAQALHGGEDYELLFAAPPSARVPANYKGVPLTRIGILRKGRVGTVLLDGAPLEPLGYDHFGSRRTGEPR